MNHPGVLTGPPVGSGKGSKSKKRAKADQNSPDNDGPVQVRRKPSVKKKKAEELTGMGQDGGGVYTSPALPPPYDECLKTAVSMQSLHSLSLEPTYQYQSVGPATFHEPSPPHSITMSPGKTRPQLPTSPTHMAALRAATQQKHAHAMQFDFSELPYGMGLYQPQQQPQQQPSQQQQQQQQQQYYHYLTPPSESIHAPESFPTPSPESPWHWSSSSPHSNSDWSEGMSSPNNNKQQDAIYI